MKNVILVIVLIVIVGLAAFLFGNFGTAPENQFDGAVEALTIPDGSYVITGGSQINWAGLKPFPETALGGGTLDISSGVVNISGESVSGEMIFDIGSINSITTPAGGGQEQLTEHLQSADFFDVENNQTARIELRELTARTPDQDGNFTVVGDLTIKGTTNEVSFPARILAEENDGVRVQAITTIDRTLWDIKFGSGKFFDDLADNVIADEVEISFDLIFRVQ